MNDIKHWFALYTKPRQEFKAENQLTSSGITTYLPSVTKIKQWSDRKKKITEPVLRGYIFIYANETERLEALEQNAVARCVHDLGRPAVIPDWQIENLKRMLQYKAEYFIQEGLVTGTRVEIIDGPFSGVIGVVQAGSEGKSIAVSIELLNRSVIAFLPKESVEKVIE
ncbi:MAG: UpxY family transcription antiterminator [Ignavibacteriaceae bacterium]